MLLIGCKLKVTLFFIVTWQIFIFHPLVVDLSSLFSFKMVIWTLRQEKQSLKYIITSATSTLKELISEAILAKKYIGW